MAEGHKVTGASLDKILTRLSSSGQNRPMNAGTFSDWSTEAGDRVTLTRDGQSYTSQVHSTTMTWKGGAPTVEMNSTGNEKRDPITKISKKKYGRSGAGGRIANNTYTWQVNQEHLLYEVTDPNGKFSRLEVTVNGLDHEVNDGDGKFSRLTNTVNGLQHVVVDEHAQAISELQNTADGFRTRIAKVVDENGTIKAASIATAINGPSSEAYINADHIRLSGNTFVNAVIGVDNSGNLIVAKNIYAGLNGSNYIQGKSLRLVGASSSQGADVQTLSATDISGMIIKAQHSGNNLKLWFHGNSTSTPDINFSKATQLSGSWSGSTLTVTASPQDEHYTIGFGGSATSHDTEFEVVANGSASKDTVVANAIVVPLKVGSLNSGSASTSRYTKNLTVSVSGLLQTMTGSNKITENGTYTPDSSHIGFSSVVVDVPSSTPSASNIDLPTSQISRHTSAPSGTGLSTLAQQLIQAYLNTDGKGRYVRFAATITGGTGTKWYYIYM